MNQLPLQLKVETNDAFKSLLDEPALRFICELQQKFGEQRESLLKRRISIQAEIDSGKHPDFLSETKDIRAGHWTVGSIPKDLLDRRVEITGPVDRKMMINALNSGAKIYMADFEDSHAPTWEGTFEGQINLRDAVNRTLEFKSPEGKQYKLNSKTATLVVRPRGWHLEEKHVIVQGKPISASLFDFGLYVFHNAKTLISSGTGPYFYLPKLENRLEARLWNDVFVFSQKKLGIPLGSIKATVLIETILAAFEIDEILFELKDHIVGLNCGRWDYIFSFIKKFRNHPDYVLPDRALVTMSKPFLKAYTDLVIQTCHKRKAHAMGGMAPQIPIKEDPEANDSALAKVVADKEREVRSGHDGTWVAHPGLVPIAMEVFDAHMKTPNQLHVGREDVRVSARDLLSVPEGEITEEGLRTNVRIGVQYLEAWLRGFGCVPLYHLMEDAATAEISRAQIWQWIRHPKGKIKNGPKITVELFRKILSEELGFLKATLGAAKYDQGKFPLAAKIFDEITTDEHFIDFLTVKAYAYL